MRKFTAGNLSVLQIFALAVVLIGFWGPPRARAEGAAFDLIGPQIEMTVNRGDRTLPVASMPNLQPGDRLWIHANLPADESAHYLLVVAFLEGPTNPPPESWFTRVETWNKKVREEGTVVTIPRDAQQCLLFLAPETGGDFSTLTSTVRARPGVFVRASQELNQASLDRTRTDKYLKEIQSASDTDAAELHARTVRLAQTLRLKINQDCFDKPADEQVSCLGQNTEQLVLDDGHSESLVAALTSGPSSDLIGAASTTPAAKAGYYSSYVGSALDLARLLGSLHTAQYQYIPALTIPDKDELNLRLNAPPSFRNPKSVLVVGLPAVESAQIPPLKALDTKQIFCLEKAPLVLPVEGAPLVFSTSIAHDFVLLVKDNSGHTIELPASADAARGGFVVDSSKLHASEIGVDATGTLRGWWGFDAFGGPEFQLRNAQTEKWSTSSADTNALIIGRDDTVQLTAGCSACVKQVTVTDSRGKQISASWQVHAPDELEVKFPLKAESAGPVDLKIEEFGLAQPDEVRLRTYTEAAQLDSFTINAGDRQGVLTGKRLDEIESFELSGIHFSPVKLSRVKQEDALNLSATDPAEIKSLQPADEVVAHAALKDGRVLELQTSVEPPRPKVSLLSKNVQPGATPFSLHLGTMDELPQDGHLSFLVKSEIPDLFPQTEKIEIATTDNSFDFTLSIQKGNLVRQDAQSVLAMFDPMKDLGASAFGSLQFRAVADDGTKGDWQPLATVVRIPTLKEVHCPDAPDKQCSLSGSNLFLLDSVASDAEFKVMVPVPLGYVEGTLNVPRPNGTLLYVKLRDDPTTVNSVALPVLPDSDAR